MPFDALKDTAVCHCGSYKEALDDALAEFQTAVEGDRCLHWYVAKTMAHATIVTILNQGLPDTVEPMRKFGDTITEQDALDHLALMVAAIWDRSGEEQVN